MLDAAGKPCDTHFIEDAHRAGLVVHPFTFRRENSFLPEELRQGNPGARPTSLRPGTCRAS
jgi:glycerophosphoryl diester phosphodiesterase